MLREKLYYLIVMNLFFLVFESPLTARVFSEKEEPSSSNKAKESQKSLVQAIQVSEDFVIGSGDVLGIFVWNEKEFSKTVPVRPDGKISLPLINDIQASGLTAMQLKEVITDKLGKFVTEPNVTVTIETVNSQRVILAGEVNGAGPRPLTGPTRVMDILASSGFTPFAKTTKIYVLRNEGNKQVRFNFNYKNYIKGKNPEENILLRNGDTIIVP